MKSSICVLITVCLLMVAPVHAQQENPQIKMKTSLGTIIVELDAKAAPKTVANFLAYMNDGFYNNTIFHRVIKGFMIQGGGLTKEMQKKATRPAVTNEADNGLKNQIGTIAMARTSAPHSATAQFFINVANNSPLDHKAKTSRGWGYCVFGRVVQGMEVVRAIEQTSTTVKAGRRDVPVQPIIIQSVTATMADNSAQTKEGAETKQ